MMFQQKEEAKEPVQDWTFLVTDVTTVPNKLGWPTYRWMPDGHISVLYDNSTRDWLVFYPNHETYRSRWVGEGDLARGGSPLPEEQEELEPSRKVLGGRLQQVGVAGKGWRAGHTRTPITMVGSGWTLCIGQPIVGGLW